MQGEIKGKHHQKHHPMFFVLIWSSQRVKIYGLLRGRGSSSWAESGWPIPTYGAHLTGGFQAARRRRPRSARTVPTGRLLPRNNFHSAFQRDFHIAFLNAPDVGWVRFTHRYTVPLNPAQGNQTFSSADLSGNCYSSGRKGRPQVGQGSAPVPLHQIHITMSSPPPIVSVQFLKR